MRAIHVVMGMGAAVALLTGCGGGPETETATERSKTVREHAEVTKERAKPLRHFEITIDGRPNPANAGILVAESRGYFEEAGLRVEIYPPEKPRRPIPYLLRRWVDVTISHQPEVVLARAKNSPVVAVGSLISQPTAAMIWLEKSKIDDVADLRGKTVAIPGLPFQKRLLRALLSQAGLTLADVTVDSVGYDLVPALAGGRADAIFGGSGNIEGPELEARGLEPVVTPVRDLGIPSYEELVFIARPDRLAEDPRSISDFMAAVARGTAAAIEDPEAAAEAVIDAYIDADPEATQAGVEATLPLLSTTGRMSTSQASRLVDWMYREGLIERKPRTSALLTDKYLEGDE